MWRSAAKDNLRPQREGYFGALSHTPRNRCVRFVFGIAAASRNTRFQAACWALPGPDLHRLIAPALLGAFPLPTLRFTSSGTRCNSGVSPSDAALPLLPSVRGPASAAPARTFLS